MARLALALALLTPLAAAGCGGGGGATTTAPTAAAPVHHGGNAQRAAQEVAAYKATVNGVLASYAVAQRKTFRALRTARDAPAFAVALGGLRRSTARAAARLASTRPPGAVAGPHRRFVAAFSSLARIIQTAIDARGRSDFSQLRRVGRRLASGEFSRPITRAAKEIDAGLPVP
jgi:predicted lipid-binding transport protein (Tim44 family)